MNRRHLLGAIATSVPLVSGCLTTVEAPPAKDVGSYRRLLDRDNFVDDPEQMDRTAEQVPFVSLKAAPSPPETLVPSARALGEAETTAGTNSTNTTNSTAPSPAETSTPEPVPPREADDGRLTVTDEYWQTRTHVSEYGIDSVSVDVYPNQPAMNSEVAKVWVGAFVYPRKKFVAEATSERFVRSEGETTVSVDINLDTAPRNERLHYVAVLLPDDADIRTVAESRTEFVMETDPFVIYPDDDRIRRAPRTENHPQAANERFSRYPIEGAYLLTLTGRTAGRSWSVSFLAFKSAFDRASARPRGRSRHEYVKYELLQGVAPELASLLVTEADNHGITDPFQQVEFAIDFVQALPYVSDDVSMGYDDYTKFALETLVSLEGDCEDTAILLASILEADPFGYDAVLIQPPGHMAVGLWYQHGDAYKYRLDGREYAYIETTGTGWGVGDIPDQYAGEPVNWYQV
ncbi:hypothetical protein [Haloarchaeobius amylolyticus]|uniref:hypothetical protein n=1 Tax=Haloarchaeobius amylolyticus TaxID=1198296 RepID=UPI00226F0E8D|nr:hypothetical protein [Haloarchaeobius amylolyticus]